MKFKQLIPFLEVYKNDIKVHCAIGMSDVKFPLKVFQQGMDQYIEWQNWQTKANFQRKYILSIVYYGKGEWLFAGIFESISVEKMEDHFQYSTKLLDIGTEFIGKAVIGFDKKFRASYLRLENHIEEFELIEIKRDACRVLFPGYDRVNVSWQDLSHLIDTDSWITALANQKGVYLITDSASGKMYVGSAYGDNMLLGRWRSYIKSGNGGNKDLKKLDFEYIKKNFNYSILEIFKSTTDDQIIIDRESWWKEVLQTRKFGYNKN